MQDKIKFIKIKSILDLIRFKKPIGFMLLLWPCCFALASLNYSQYELLIWYVYFIIGAFLMRSAGCIINDLVDIKLDKKIKRTFDRPLTSKKISILEALIILIIFLFLSFLILIQFKLNTILFGILSLPFIVIYPYMKRYTYWPQLFLGIIFSWGVLLVSIEFYNKINIEFFILYLACIFWTLAYDTIYAYQDIKDDIKNNIKSTAVLFGYRGKYYVRIFYTIFLSLIGFLVYISSNNFYSLPVIIIYIFAINQYLNKWEIKSEVSSNHYFNFNNVIGMSCFIFILIF